MIDFEEDDLALQAYARGYRRGYDDAKGAGLAYGQREDLAIMIDTIRHSTPPVLSATKGPRRKRSAKALANMSKAQKLVWARRKAAAKKGR